MTLEQLDKQNIWHPYTALQQSFEPLVISSAKGIYLFTSDGKKIIDGISSWWVNLHGHCNPIIADAISEQARKLEHVIFAGFTHEPAIKLSENLLKILPDNHSKIFFSDNGSTAVEVAIKMAIQFWRNQGNHRRRKIIAIEGAYHGDTFGSMAVSGRSIFTDAFKEYLFNVDFIDFPNDDNEEKVKDQFKQLIHVGDVAAFIFEPLVQGASGMRIYSPDILNELLKIANEANVISIADEVFTGFGRTGKILASEYLAHKPDIITLSKGITGGFLPLGVTSCSKSIISEFNSPDYSKTLYHGHSYTANPLACAAANASFAITTSSDCSAAIATISKHQELFCNSIRKNRHVKSVKCLGTILSIELKSSDKSGYTNDWREVIYPYFLERGILLRPLGNVLYVLPPYVINLNELKFIHSEIEEFLDGR